MVTKPADVSLMLRKYLKTHPFDKVRDIATRFAVAEDVVRSIRNELRMIEDVLVFTKIWNDGRAYPAKDDLERAFGMSMRSLQSNYRKYSKYILENPEQVLGKLVARRTLTGRIIPVSEEVRALQDAFRFDTALLKGARGIIVTAAQRGGTINRHVWKSLHQCATYRDFPLVVLPIQYGPVIIKDGVPTSFYPEEVRGHMVFEDIELCRGELWLNVSRFRPTLQRFLTDSVCEMGGLTSQIFAAPMLELEYRPRVGHHYPKAIMTSGAVTYPNYMVDSLGQQDRTGEVATVSHTYAAIVVEFDDDTFHFRQLHANSEGEFYDINPLAGGADFFTPHGVTHAPHAVNTIVCGDWHTGKTDRDVRKSTFGKHGMAQTLNPKHVVLHDFVDCDSVSPHERRQGVRRAYKPHLGWESLQDELEAAVAELTWIQSCTDADIHIVASNHIEFVRELIEHPEAWARDDRNIVICAELHRMMFDEMKLRKPKKHLADATDPVVLWFRKHTPTVYALERQDVLLLPKGIKNSILCSLHGDIGTRGKETRGTGVFRKMNKRVILGHNHSACIQGPVWRVGTSTPRMQFYVKNPVTDWTNTHAIIYANGQRQLINFVNGKWHGKIKHFKAIT
jgi:hypothetical protein